VEGNVKMANWTAPFHSPRLTDDEFEARKKAYTDKNGYTVSVPTFSDIIHLRAFEPITEREKELYTGTRLLTEQEKADYYIKHLPEEYDKRTFHDIWLGKKQDYGEGIGPPERKLIEPPDLKGTGLTVPEWRRGLRDEIPSWRLSDIKKEKQKKKEKYLAMLADPSPRIARNAAGILTALDDVQDALSTIACIGMIGAAVIGGPIAAAILGPLGLILGASTLLNLVNPFSRIRKAGGGVGTGRAGKKRVEAQTNHNPFSKQAKVTLARRISKFRPSTGNVIEALQTTDQVFGVGISIGPIMGFIQGAISGVIRSALGQPVKVAVGAPGDTKINSAASKALRATALLHGYQWHSDATDEAMTLYASSLAMQALYASIEDFNPFDEIEDTGNYLVECPQPTDPLTLEILAEEGFDLETGATWPQNDQRWISMGTLQEQLAEQAALNVRHYAEENNHTLEAYNALTAVDDFALNFLAAVEGPEQIRVDFLRIEKIVSIILDNGWEYPMDITEAQVAKFEDWCYVHEYMDTQPSGKEIAYYAETFCGFSWTKSPDQLR